MLKGLPVRIPQIGSVLGALFLFGEERTFHVDAEQGCTVLRLLVPQAFCREIRRLQHIIGQCHRRRSEAGYPVLRQVPCHFFQALIVPVRKIRPGIAVGVNVNQARNHVLSLQIDTVLRPLSLPDLAEYTVLDGKPGPCEALILQKYICVLEFHHALSSYRFFSAPLLSCLRSGGCSRCLFSAKRNGLKLRPFPGSFR